MDPLKQPTLEPEQDRDNLTAEQIRELRMESDAKTPELFIVNGKQMLTSWENGVVGAKVVTEEIGPSHPLFVRGLNG